MGATFPNPYTDPDITHDFVEDGDLPAKEIEATPAKSWDPRQEAANDVEGRVTDTSTLDPQDPAPQAKQFWVIDETLERSRDPYRNDGMVGQDFLQNQA
jgi:hypothetical protein